MELFTNKKTKGTKEADAPAVVSAPKVGVNIATFLMTPRITEKATVLAERNVYTFNVPQGTTKGAVAEAVFKLYKVHPYKVAIVKTPAARVLARGKRGKTAASRKAYVYLKEGDKIEFV
jgi:ribosomal protein L23